MLIEGKNCWRRTHADRAAFLVDGAAYFDAFARAALRARSSILIIGWDFNSRTRLWADDPPVDVPAELGDFLDFLARRKRKLKIHVLDWDFPVMYAVNREFPPIFGLAWKPRRNIRLRFDCNFPIGGSQHQKIVVIDNAMAFVGGIDFATDRWDTPQHKADDMRRAKAGVAHPPVHDVMIAVDGEAAQALGDLASERWRRATGEKLAPVKNGDDPWPPDLVPDLSGVTVGISRTEPGYGAWHEVREVETLYVDMISAARKLVYIENQYFSSSRIGAAIEERLQHEDSPEIILVLRQCSDGWLEGPTMGMLRTQLLERLRRADRFDRLHVFYPVVPGLENNCINVHAKLCIVDDELVRVGSANLNNRSMGLDTECDVTIDAAGADAVRRAIAGFRNRLLAEHLGTDPHQVENAMAQEGSAAAAIASLSQGERRLVPFSEAEAWPVTLAPIVELADLESPVAADQFITRLVPCGPAAKSSHHLSGWLLVLLVLGGLFAAWHWTPLSEYISAQAVGKWSAQLADEPAGPLIIIAAYTLATLTLFPRTLITLTAVLAFGPLNGFAYAMAGILGAALLTYSIGRTLSRDTIRRIAGPRLNRLSGELRKRGLLSVVTVRLLPIAPFIVVNMVAGASRIKVIHYSLGTAIGVLPGTLTATVFGGGINSALQDPANINYGLIGVLVAIVLLALLVLRKWLKKHLATDGKATSHAE